MKGLQGTGEVSSHRGFGLVVVFNYVMNELDKSSMCLGSQMQ